MRRLAARILRLLPPSVQYRARVLFGTPKRYRNLLTHIHANRSASILEIGVYRGKRSMEMIETAALFRPASEVRYYGFDLFEGLNDDLLKSEFSKVPPSEQEIRERLEESGAQIHLYKGFSQDTLPLFIEQWKKDGSPSIDFVFIDGGHAEETIASDWMNVRQLMGPQTVVIFDDYYSRDYSQHIGRVGCQYLIDALDKNEFDVSVLGPEDCFEKDWGTLCIKLGKARLKARN